MGSVQEYTSKATGKRGGWRAMWRDHEGRQRSKSFERKIDADNYLATVEADLLRGEYIDPRAGQTTLASYAMEWMAQQDWRPSTRSLAESHWRNHIGPALGSRRLAALTRTDIQGFVTALSRTTHEKDGLAPKTVEAVYRRLVSILEAAVYDRKIAHSPAVKITLPKADKAASDQVVPLDLDQVRQLVEVLPERLGAFAWTIAMAGLRPGEAAGLTLERVDFDERTIKVDRQLTTIVRDKDDTPPGETRTIALLAPLKTPSSYRTVPIGDTLVETLRSHTQQHEPVEIEPGATLLFSNRDGKPLRRNVLGDAWDRARNKLDMPAEARGWHTLRHTYASWLIEAGLSVKTVQARLGHKSATETLDTYAHLWPDSDDDTRQAIEGRLASVEPTMT